MSLCKTYNVLPTTKPPEAIQEIVIQTAEEKRSERKHMENPRNHYDLLQYITSTMQEIQEAQESMSRTIDSIESTVDSIRWQL